MSMLKSNKKANVVYVCPQTVFESKFYFFLWSPEEILYNIHPPSPEKSEEELVCKQRRGRLASLSLHQNNSFLNDTSFESSSYRGATSPHSAPIKLATPSSSHFLRTPTLGGKWIWKSVDIGQKAEKLDLQFSKLYLYM